MDDIAKEIEVMCEENKEDEYRDSLIEMIQALDKSFLSFRSFHTFKSCLFEFLFWTITHHLL